MCIDKVVILPCRGPLCSPLLQLSRLALMCYYNLQLFSSLNRPRDTRQSPLHVLSASGVTVSAKPLDLP
jgi:hypothetical protein